jgi:hypothetical protein
MAQDIVRGIDRNAALVVAPASARLAWRIWRYTPLVANRMTARHLAWARATFGVQPAEAGAGGTAVEASGGSPQATSVSLPYEGANGRRS